MVRAWLVSLILAACPQAQAEPCTPRDVRVMFLGGSITAGCHDGGSDSAYRLMLQETIPEFTPVGSLTTNCSGSSAAHEGHGGWQIGQVADVASGLMADHEPDVVVLLIGTNNYRDDDADFRAEYQALADALQGDVYAVTPPPIGYGRTPETSYWTDEWVDGRNVLLSSMGDALHDVVGVSVVDVRGQFAREHMVPDAVHLNAAGHRIIADALLEQIDFCEADDDDTP